MNVSLDLPAASRNLLDTHYRLARAIEGTAQSQYEGFVACTGPLNHTICNVAGNLDLDEHRAEQLARMALDHGAFQVVSVPGDRPDEVHDVLADAGFSCKSTLTMMQGNGAAGSDLLDLREAQSRAERSHIAAFMVSQFYGGQTRAFTGPVAEATAASGMKLFAHWNAGQPIGAVMLNGSSGICGVYNLCVAENYRRHGIGAGILEWCQRFAHEHSIPLTLQCDESLVEWYGKYGLEVFGSVKGFSLDSKPGSALDILN